MKDIFVLKDPSFLVIEKWSEMNKNVYAGFTTKNGGSVTSKFGDHNLGLHVGDDPNQVVENRRSLAEKLSFSLDNWVSSEQTHRNVVYEVTEEDSGKGSSDFLTSIKDCDGMFTHDHNILLALTYADCVPIYFFSPQKKLIGIVHAGWKGTVTKISESLVNQWIQQYDVNPKDIFAAIGPSICNHCYIVDNRVIQEVEKLDIPDKHLHYQKVNETKFSLNLKTLNKSILQNLGIPEANIDVTDYCTSCHHELFYSHRRDKGSTGRMLGFIGFREE